MKIKVDENIPTSLQGLIASHGHDDDTVRSEGIAGQDDDVVWQHATNAERFLITQDLDFSDIRRFTPGTHHGILLVRLRDPGLHALRARIAGLFETENVDAWSGCLVVATDTKLRIRRPR
jgi:predicted nuclease of predicted toxin-antitoxin system